jgi:hypothetical protein
MASRGRGPSRRTYWVLGLIFGSGHAAIAAPAGSAPSPPPCAEAKEYEPKAAQIASCSQLRSDPERLAERLAHELGLAPFPALHLARGLAEQSALDEKWHDIDARSRIDALRKIEADYIKALKLAPEAAEIATQLRWFYGLQGYFLAAPAAELAALIAASPDPAILALRLVQERPTLSDPISTPLLLAALTARPRAADLWEQAALYAQAPAWKLAFFAEALRDALAPDDERPGGLAAAGPSGQRSGEPAVTAPAGQQPGGPVAAGPSGQRPGGPAAAAPVAARFLAELFDAGLAQDAVSILHGLPRPVRARLGREARLLDRGPEQSVSSFYGGRDLRVDLAAAHLLTGDRQAARAWAARGRIRALSCASANPPPHSRSLDSRDPFDPGNSIPGNSIPGNPINPNEKAGTDADTRPIPEQVADKDAQAARRQLRQWQATVACSLSSTGTDPFALLADWAGGEGTWSWSIGHALTGARLARREGYPAVAEYLLADAVQRVQARDRAMLATSWQPASPVPPRVRRDAELLATQLAGANQAVAGEIAAARAALRAGLGPDPAAATIARLLAAPPLAVFAEHPLPAALRSAATVPGEAALPSPPALPYGAAPGDAALPSATAPDCGDAASPGAGGPAAGPAPPLLQLPPGFAAVRAERQGQRAAAIGLSQDYDPAGEVSGGAYWVILSEDGGATWERPLYTGLRVNQPYVVRERSELPLLAGDRLQVEVEVRELDPETIVLPPVALRPKRVATGLYVDAPISLLRQDSDGDGLTDLAEERLLTDPLDADTDHDGCPDGLDPLPHVAPRQDESAAARALEVVLDAVAGSARHAIVQGVSAATGPAWAPHPPPVLGGENTLFLVGERGFFAGVRSSRRLVVLTAAEAAAAEKKFGPSFPTTIKLFALDRTGRSAIAIWSSGWQGGTLRLEEQDGKWQILDDAFWIT